MSTNEKIARIIAFLVLFGASLAIPIPGEPSFDFTGQLVGVGLFAVIFVGALWIERRQRVRMAAAVAPENPAFGRLAPVEALLTSESHRWPLRGKVRELRTYSVPRCISEDGMMTPSYYSVIIDTNGEVHDLEQGGRFGAIEERAKRLAEHLAVPFVSGI